MIYLILSYIIYHPLIKIWQDYNEVLKDGKSHEGPLAYNMASTRTRANPVVTITLWETNTPYKSLEKQ